MALRVSKQPEERKAELIAAARALFDEKGVGATRVSDIVRRVGVAQGVFYYYFASRQEMVRAVEAEVSEEVNAKIVAILQSDTPLCEKIAQMIELVLDLVDQFLGDEETALPAKKTMGGNTVFTAQCVAQIKDALKRLVEEGAKTGQVTAAYPWQSTLLLLHGFQAMAETQLPQRNMVYTITEETLGLPKGGLVHYLLDAKKQTNQAGKKHKAKHEK